MASFVFGEKRPDAVKKEPKPPSAGQSPDRQSPPRASGPRHARPQVLAAMEALFNRDFSDVRIHDGNEGDQVARAAGAPALTVGQDIYFRRGAFAPATADGRRVLGHELAHVVQQSGAPAASGAPVPLGARGTSHEREAARAGEAIAAGAAPRVDLRARAPVAQRFESYEHAALGDRTDAFVGGGVRSTPGVAPVSDAEKERLANDRDVDRGGAPLGRRTVRIALRKKDPRTDAPTTETVNVPLSYGELEALSGDVYYSADNLKLAPADEVIELRDLLRAQIADPTSQNFDLAFETATQWRRKGVYQPGTGKKEGTLGQYYGVQPNNQDDTASYLDLAGSNAAHFAAETGTAVTADGPEGNAAPDNHQAWFTDHNRAIAIAKRVRAIKEAHGQLRIDPIRAAGEGGRAVGQRTDPVKDVVLRNGVPTAPPPAPASAKASAAAPNDKALEDEAYLYNAAADHYLTDAFSAGHLINRKAVYLIVDRVVRDDPAVFEKLVDDLAPFAVGKIPVLNYFIKPYLRNQLKAVMDNDSMRHNAGVKLIHDWLNAHGAHVVSINGRFSWLTKGDAHMDAATRDVASRAVLASRNYIRALMNDSDEELAKPTDADDAWSYTPNVDATKFSAMAEPWLRDELHDTPHLWELVQSLRAAKGLQEDQQKGEKKAQEKAKDDKGGDWGKQPTNARFTRRFVLPRVK